MKLISVVRENNCFTSATCLLDISHIVHFMSNDSCLRHSVPVCTVLRYGLHLVQQLIRQ